jgi:rubrerythrin
MAVKNAMTSDFLHSACSGGKHAHMRYLTWADMAEKEGLPILARLAARKANCTTGFK